MLYISNAEVRAAHLHIQTVYVLTLALQFKGRPANFPARFILRENESGFYITKIEAVDITSAGVDILLESEELISLSDDTLVSVWA